MIETMTSAAVITTNAAICHEIFGRSPETICISITAEITKAMTVIKNPMLIFRKGVKGNTLSMAG